MSCAEQGSRGTRRLKFEKPLPGGVSTGVLHLFDFQLRLLDFMLHLQVQADNPCHYQADRHELDRGLLLFEFRSIEEKGSSD
jgi:alpha-D-ribose 1-methylphosphonate 5-triphosphate synthase subunit PhnI